VTLVTIITEKDRMIAFNSELTLFRVVKVLRDMLDQDIEDSTTFLSNLLGTYKTFPAHDIETPYVVINFIDQGLVWQSNEDSLRKKWKFDKFRKPS